MRLPARNLHQFLQRGPVLALQKVQDRRGLAAVAGAGGFLRAPGRFLRGGAFFPDLAFFGATLRAGLAPLAFWVAFGASAAGARAVSSASAVEIMMFCPLLAGFPHHMDHSGRKGKQADSKGNRTLANGWR
jgi:hypothetical protein